MQILLDTHVIVWWFNDAAKLSEKARTLVKDGKNHLFLSSGAIWEIRIKEALGKLFVEKTFIEDLLKQKIYPLDFTWEHANRVESLPSIHRDPFDRMMIAQAITEDLTLLTADKIISKYPVRTVW